MKSLKRGYFLELPSEIILHVISFLSFDDLFSIVNVGNQRLKECAIIIMKGKQFSKYLI